MKKITKKLAVIALSAAFAVSAGAAVGAFTYNRAAITASAAFTDGMTKVDTAPERLLALEKGTVKNITFAGYYDSDADGAADLWSFTGDGSATKDGNISFNTEGTDTTASRATKRTYDPKPIDKISFDYKITNSGTANVTDTESKYAVQILAAVEKGKNIKNFTYTHIPEIVDDGEWHTLTIELTTAFSGDGTAKELPNASTFNDIADNVCAFLFKTGADFNGEIAFKNLQVVEGTIDKKTLDLADAFTYEVWGKTGDYAEALQYRLTSPDFTKAYWYEGTFSANGSLSEDILKAIKINGKSIFDYNAEYNALIASGEASPITWTGMPNNEGATSGSKLYLPQEIADEVNEKNKTAKYAPIYVKLVDYSAASLGSAIDIYIPQSYLDYLDMEVKSITISKDLKVETEKYIFGVRDDVTFAISSFGSNPTPTKQIGEAKKYNVLETSITKINGASSSTTSWDSCLSFYLSKCDYAEAKADTSYINEVKETLLNINFFDYILFDGVKMSKLYNSAEDATDDQLFYSVWGRTNALSMRWPTALKNETAANGVKEITILKGCQFPSLKDDSTVYEVKEDTTFLLAGSGIYLKETDSYTAEEVTVSNMAPYGTESELYKIDIFFDGWVVPKNPAGDPDTYDLNYSGTERENLRKSIFINGVSVYDIQKVDDSEYKYSTFPWTHDNKDTFQHPALVEGNDGKITVYIHKDYIDSLNADTITLTMAKGFVHYTSVYWAAEEVSAIVYAKPINVTLDGKVSEYMSGQTVANLKAPTAAGKTFAGWLDADGNKVEDSFVLTEGLALTSSWTINEYTLTVNLPNATETVVFGVEKAGNITATPDELAAILAEKLPEDTAQFGYTWDKEIPADFALENCEFTVVVTEYFNKTIDEVLATEDGTGVIVSGIVCEVGTWNDKYSNMNFTIKDADGNQLLVYRSSLKVGLGDTVTVRGIVESREEGKRIAEGATVTITAAHECTDLTEATCTEAAVCKVCGKTNGTAKGHTEVVDEAVAPTCTEKGLTEGKHCSACGEVLVEQEEVPANGHAYEDGVCHCGAEDPNYNTSSDTTSDTTSDSASDTDDEQPAESGCGSVAGLGVALSGVALAAVALVIKKRKED